jgi:methionyl-tRNA formyltransferase
MLPLKVIFFSSSSFCVPIIDAILANSELELVGVVTQPDWTNRGKVYKNPISKYLEKKDIKLFQPTKINQSIDDFKKEFPIVDLGIVASYGQIISTQVLDHPKLGMINWHPSLLPKYRGPTPLQTSILNGDTNGGLTWIKMDKGMDSGDIIKQYNIEYNNKKFSELILELGLLGGKTIDEVIKLYIQNINSLTVQNHTQLSTTKMINKEDAMLNDIQNITSLQLMNHYRAFDAFPKTKITSYKFGMIKLLDIEIWNKSNLTIDEEDQDFYYAGGKIILKTKDGVILVRELQLESGRIIKSSK